MWVPKDNLDQQEDMGNPSKEVLTEKIETPVPDSTSSLEQNQEGVEVCPIDNYAESNRSKDQVKEAEENHTPKNPNVLLANMVDDLLAIKHHFSIEDQIEENGRVNTTTIQSLANPETEPDN